MNIGILTYHHAHNYGAYLQACALCNRLNMEEDINCEIIDFRMQKEADFYSFERIGRLKRILRPFKFKFKKELHQTFERAISDPIMKKSEDSIVSDSIDVFKEFVKGKYDVIIAGSDEIWKTDAYRGFPTPYWLFGDLGCRKFAYAASSRSDFSKLPKEQYEELKRAVNDFEFIGVRDKCTSSALLAIVDDKTKIQEFCDPSFLYDFDVQKKPIHELLEGKARLSLKKKTIVVMTNNRKVAMSFSFNFCRDYNLVSVFYSHPGYFNIPNLTPLEWLEIVKNADLFVTTYFHGTCFSIIYNTPFISFGTLAKNSKIEGLFSGTVELKNHYIEDTETFLRQPDFKKKVIELMIPVDATEYISVNRERFNILLEALRCSENL